MFNLHFVKTGIVPKDYAKTFNDLFERRQESDYVDYVRFTERQVHPKVEQDEEFVAFINNLIQKENH
jgi:uncharacterized protein (UPF0332 family)